MTGTAGWGAGRRRRTGIRRAATGPGRAAGVLVAVLLAAVPAGCASGAGARAARSPAVSGGGVPGGADLPGSSAAAVGLVAAARRARVTGGAYRVSMTLRMPAANGADADPVSVVGVVQPPGRSRLLMGDGVQAMEVVVIGKESWTSLGGQGWRPSGAAGPTSIDQVLSGDVVGAEEVSGTGRVRRFVVQVRSAAGSGRSVVTLDAAGRRLLGVRGEVPGLGRVVLSLRDDAAATVSRPA